MNRLKVVLYAIGATYAVVLALFHAVLEPGTDGLTWHVWRLCAIVTLLGTSLELVLMLLWCGLKFSLVQTNDCVPERLGRKENSELDRLSVSVAILLPAHREASTPEDAQNLARRLTDMLLKTPPFASLFILFDSPESERDNELGVIDEVCAALATLDRSADASRLRFEEYRNKPANFRNKPGSISLWLDKHATVYDYLFVLDADSSLPDEDPQRPETCDVLARMVLAMERAKCQGTELAMIQAAIAIRPLRTGERRSLWGRFQLASSAISLRYHARLLLEWVLRGQCPSFGHNILFRTTSFVRFCRNTHEYLSHDYIDAADLATAGCQCVYSSRALTYEEPEASLLQWVTRDFRWARGNASWIVYWLTKPALALGPRFFLACGILAYVLPIAATLFLFASASLIGDGIPLVSDARPWLTHGLMTVILATLFFPKAAGCRSSGEFFIAALPGLLMTPTLVVQSAFFFLIGAFGKSWSLRGSRSNELDGDHLVRIVKLFVPVAVLGTALWVLLDGPGGPWSDVLVGATVLALVASPLSAVLLSVPWPVSLRWRQRNSMTLSRS
jgi:membrane glycosyltransferase